MEQNQPRAHFEQNFAAYSPFLHHGLLETQEIESRKQHLFAAPQSLLTFKQHMLRSSVFSQTHARHEFELLVYNQLQDFAQMQLSRKKSHELIFHSHLAQMLDDEEKLAQWLPGKTALDSALQVTSGAFVAGSFGDVQQHIQLGEHVSADALLTVIAAAHDAHHFSQLQANLTRQHDVIHQACLVDSPSVLGHVYNYMQELFADELHHIACLAHQELHTWAIAAFTFSDR